MKKIKSILLVDDDKATNFLHQMIIEEQNCCEDVHISENGEIAIQYLSTPDKDGNYPQPELIFLDINMPKMNGWEFLEAYKQLPDHQKTGMIIVMLTSSINPADYEMAIKHNFVTSFKEKPLSYNALDEILNDYFLGKI